MRIGKQERVLERQSNDLAQTSNSVARVDPRNQPVSEVTASAEIVLKGAAFNILPHWGAANVARLSIYSNSSMAYAPLLKPVQELLVADDFGGFLGNFTGTNGIARVNHIYTLHFH